MTKNFWSSLKKPFLVLAPMAGYTDSAFRLICKKFGADVVISELISADAIAHGKFSVSSSQLSVKVSSSKSKNTAELLSFYQKERPFVVQLFGKNPENFAKASKWITEELKPDGIDINMGCPARKVVGSDHGAALLKNTELALRIVKAVKDNTNLPVSVKTRLGWDSDDQILDFGPKLIQAGISAIIVHGRTYKDGFSGSARWENILKLKEMVGSKGIVIGNGDFGANPKFSVLSSQFSLLDGVAIGRATFGKPYIFSSQFSVLSFQKLKDLILEHAKLAYESKGDRGIIEFRKHLLTYLKGFPGAKDFRKKAVSIEKWSDIEIILDGLREKKNTKILTKM